MKIHQFYTDSVLRNFTYFIELDNNEVFVIDPWDAGFTNDFIRKNKFKLTTIINTHEHWDHIQGNKELVDLHHCEVWAHANGEGKIPGLSRLLGNDEIIELTKDCKMQVLDTPGHSQAHLCFIIIVHDKPKYIFTGDILFNAGVGNCHNGGDALDLYETITNKIATLPDDIIIYPGHEYLKNNLEFTLNREPSNAKARQWLKKYEQADINTNPLTTTMADEREINTFLRLDNEEIITNLPSTVESDQDVFIELRSLRNDW